MTKPLGARGRPSARAGRPAALPWLAALLGLALSACSTGKPELHPARPEPETPPEVPPPAAVEAPQGAPAPAEDLQTLVVALDRAVDPGHVPIPHNVSERTVFRNLYETLVTAEPDGTLRPGLAESWSSLDGDRQWTFRLRPGARFWDGTPVRAADVAASWRMARPASLASRGHSPLLWISASRVEVVDEATLAVRLAEPQADFPALLAHVDLSVFRPREDGWPLGTGPIVPADGADAGAAGAGAAGGGLDPDAGGDLVCVPSPFHPAAPAWRRLIFRLRPGADPRDLLDAADLVVARDRDVLDYYRALDGVRLVALPWDRLYLLLVPPDQDQRERERWYTGWQAFDLARDVVAAVAEPARVPFFVPPEGRICPQLTGPVERVSWPSFDWPDIATARDRDMLLHPRGDADGRRLAERLAVVAARLLRPAPERPGAGPLQPPYPPAPGAAPQAVAVPAVDWAGAVQSGRAGAYLYPLRRQYPTACLQFSSLLGLSDWLQRTAGDSDLLASRFPPSARAGAPAQDFDLSEIEQAALRLRHDGIVTPLVVTRATLVLRRGLYGVGTAFDGSPLLAAVAWRTAAGAAP